MQNEIFPPSPIESPAIAATPFPQTLIKEAEKASLKEPKEIMDAIAAIDEYSQTLAKGTPTSFLAEKKLSQRAMLEALAVLPDHILEYTLEKYKMTTPFGNRVPAASLSDVQSFRRDEKAKNEPQTEPQEEAQPDPVSPSTDDKPKPTNFEELENLWRWLGVSQKDEEGFLTFPKNKAAKGLRVSSDRICFGDEKTAAIDPHVLRFTMLHAQKFWNGRLNVEGTPEHKMRITAYAELFNLKVCNYNPTREERVEIDRLKKQIPITANNNDDAAIPKKRGGFQNMKKRVATTLKLAI